jgi:transposase
MSKQRRHFLDTEKVAILKRHLIDKVPVSDLCDELDLYPNQFYDWLKKFFENGHLAFANGRKSKAVEDAKDHRGSSGSKPSSNARTPSSANSWKSTSC